MSIGGIGEGTLLFALNIAAGAGLGVAIGLERQWRGRRSGLRGNALGALGGAIFAGLARMREETWNGVWTPEEIGIGLAALGAWGMLVSAAGRRSALSGATLWCSALVGAGAGAGFVTEAALGAAAVLGVNLALRPLGGMLDGLSGGARGGRRTGSSSSRSGGASSVRDQERESDRERGEARVVRRGRPSRSGLEAVGRIAAMGRVSGAGRSSTGFGHSSRSGVSGIRPGSRKAMATAKAARPLVEEGWEGFRGDFEFEGPGKPRRPRRRGKVARGASLGAAPRRRRRRVRPIRDAAPSAAGVSARKTGSGVAVGLGSVVRGLEIEVPARSSRDWTGCRVAYGLVDT